MFNGIYILLSECAHTFLREEFSPKTGLVIQHSLNDYSRTGDGFRSKTSSFELTWTILDLQRIPPKTRCCYRCNPELVVPFVPADKHDPRLVAFSHHFQYGLALPLSRPGSSVSIQTNTSTASNFAPHRQRIKVPQEEQDKLRERLTVWRNKKHHQQRSPIFLSAQIILPPKQLNAFVIQSPRFLQEPTLTTHLLRKLVPWDSATESDLEEVLLTINSWRETAAIIIPSTPSSQRRARKKTRANEPNNLASPQQARPIMQPNFTSHPTPNPVKPVTQSAITARFRLPLPSHVQPQIETVYSTNPFVDENVFQTPNQPTQSHQPSIPRPYSYAAAVSSWSTPSTTGYNPYRQLLTPAVTHGQRQYYSPLTSSSLSWTPTLSTPVHERPSVQYQFTPKYTPSTYTPQSHK
jgi:hypothetical protein